MRAGLPRPTGPLQAAEPGAPAPLPPGNRQSPPGPPARARKGHRPCLGQGRPEGCPLACLGGRPCGRFLPHQPTKAPPCAGPIYVPRRPAPPCGPGPCREHARTALPVPPVPTPPRPAAKLWPPGRRCAPRWLCPGPEAQRCDPRPPRPKPPGGVRNRGPPRSGYRQPRRFVPDARPLRPAPSSRYWRAGPTAQRPVAGWPLGSAHQSLEHAEGQRRGPGRARQRRFALKQMRVQEAGK